MRLRQALSQVMIEAGLLDQRTVDGMIKREGNVVTVDPGPIYAFLMNLAVQAKAEELRRIAA